MKRLVGLRSLLLCLFGLFDTLQVVLDLLIELRLVVLLKEPFVCTAVCWVVRVLFVLRHLVLLTLYQLFLQRISLFRRSRRNKRGSSAFSYIVLRLHYFVSLLLHLPLFEDLPIDQLEQEAHDSRHSCQDLLPPRSHVDDIDKALVDAEEVDVDVQEFYLELRRQMLPDNIVVVYISLFEEVQDDHSHDHIKHDNRNEEGVEQNERPNLEHDNQLYFDGILLVLDLLVQELLGVLEGLALVCQRHIFLHLPDPVDRIDEGENELDDYECPRLTRDCKKFNRPVDSIIDLEEDGWNDQIKDELEHDSGGEHILRLLVVGSGKALLAKSFHVYPSLSFIYLKNMDIPTRASAISVGKNFCHRVNFVCSCSEESNSSIYRRGQQKRAQQPRSRSMVLAKVTNFKMNLILWSSPRFTHRVSSSYGRKFTNTSVFLPDLVMKLYILYPQCWISRQWYFSQTIISSSWSSNITIAFSVIPLSSRTADFRMLQSLSSFFRAQFFFYCLLGSMHSMHRALSQKKVSILSLKISLYAYRLFTKVTLEILGFSPLGRTNNDLILSSGVN